MTQKGHQAESEDFDQPMRMCKLIWVFTERTSNLLGNAVPLLNYLSILLVGSKFSGQTDIHYENTPIQIYWNFHHQKNWKFSDKNSDIFLISAQIIDCGYSLELPRRGGSNEYPQSMFLSRNKKNNVYPCKPQFYYIKVGFQGVKII